MTFSLKNYAIISYFKFIDFLHRPFVKKSTHDPLHRVYQDFLSIGKKIDAPAVLEIGSRNVTGVTRRDIFPHHSEYVGFDILPGENVDIVGDVHKLSEYCSLQHFDLVYSMVVFEHLLFPWKAVLEINKVMKLGGYVYLVTVPFWPAHALPWDFWRFLSNAFHGLFNKHTGFEIISLAEGVPCRAYSLSHDSATRTLWSYTINLGVALIARKTGDYRSDLLKWDIDVSDAISSMYPGE